MIFVPLKDDIQCFHASTLESLWCYRHPVKGGGTIAVNSPIRYENGIVIKAENGHCPEDRHQFK